MFRIAGVFGFLPMTLLLNQIAYPWHRMFHKTVFLFVNNDRKHLETIECAVAKATNRGPKITIDIRGKCLYCIYNISLRLCEILIMDNGMKLARGGCPEL